MRFIFISFDPLLQVRHFFRDIPVYFNLLRLNSFSNFLHFNHVIQMFEEPWLFASFSLLILLIFNNTLRVFLIFWQVCLTFRLHHQLILVVLNYISHIIQKFIVFSIWIIFFQLHIMIGQMGHTFCSLYFLFLISVKNSLRSFMLL